MKAHWLLLALLPAIAAAQPAQRPADAAPNAPAAQVHALPRLEAQLRQHLLNQGSRAPMPWREALVLPDAERLVWGRTMRWNRGRLNYRVAFDPLTRWYYVVRANRRGQALYFGPIEEGFDGRFVDWRSGGGERR